ncbi:UBX domain-containing protein 7-like, partial [Trifolium medium]|nr:UBX domain-containing protein 7-like [Trifolium medium]
GATLGHLSQEPNSLIAFRNFEQETRRPGVWESEQGAASTAESSQDTLASLYRPPFHLMFTGSFDKIAARSADPRKCYSGIADSGMTAIVKTKKPCTKT